MKKLLNLLNVKNWIETFLLKTLVNKTVKHAVAAVLGIVLGGKVQPILGSLGVTIDQAKFQTELTILFTGLAGWLVNWFLQVLDRDGDGKIG